MTLDKEFKEKVIDTLNKKAYDSVKDMEDSYEYKLEDKEGEDETE